jgi:O-antigen/teichoic acid export membrane protein
MTLSDIVRIRPSAWQFPGYLMPNGLADTLLRYAASVSGPVAVSGAHFLASLIFLRNLPAREFGLFSFVMVVVSFGLSLNGALITVPLTRHLAIGADGTRPACFQMNGLVCAGFAALMFVALLCEHAPLEETCLLSLFAAIFTFRWFARCLAFVEGQMAAAVKSDLAYSLFLIGGLGVISLTHQVSFIHGSAILLVAALVALLPFGFGFFRSQLAAMAGSPRRYWPIFRDLSRWSLIGVVLTEMTVNAHAYLVTFISGASAFALLALGMLLMRPASLIQSALSDLERPAMSRAIAAGDMALLSRIRRHFTWVLFATWLANMLLCALLLGHFPLLVLKKGYGLDSVIPVTILSSIIMAVRAWRTPLAVLLQAAGRFKDLAGIGTASSAIAVVATLALLLSLGPIASLGGIVVGELVILAKVILVARDWKQSHG